MNINRLILQSLLSLIVINVIACGASSSTGLDGTGGPPKTTVTRGVVSASEQDSITINDIDYDTADTTQVELNGQEASPSDLQAGLVLTITGQAATDSDTLAASRVIYDNSVLGPVTSVNPDTREFIALGQQVLVSDNTVLGEGVAEKLAQAKRDATDLSSNPGVMDVSGILNNDGAISATRIDLVEQHRDYEVTGIITDLDGNFFQIGAQLRIDIRQAQFEGFNNQALQNGMLIEVKINPANISNAFPDTTEAIADRVIFKAMKISV